MAIHIILLLTVAVVSSYGKEDIYLGCIYPTSNNFAAIRGQGYATAVKIAAKLINQRDDILPDYNLKILFKDSQLASRYAVKSLVELISEKRQIFGFLGPVSSSCCEGTAAVAPFWNLIQITEDLVAQFKKVGIDYDIQSFAIDPVARVDKLKDADTRIYVLYVYPAQAIRIICRAYELNMFGPGHVWFLPEWYGSLWYDNEIHAVNCSRNQIRQTLDGSFGLQQVFLSSDNLTTISGLTPQQYVDQYLAISPSKQIRDENTLSFDSLWAFALALNRTDAILRETNENLTQFTYNDTRIRNLLYSSLSNLTFDGISGRVAFVDGDRTGDIEISQYQVGVNPNKNTVVGLYSSKDDRTYLNRTNFIRWPGCILCYASLIIYGLDAGLVDSQAISHSCIAYGWILCFGFTLSFGSLFSKTWRVYRIYSTGYKKKIIIRDKRLVLWIIVLAIIDTCLLLLWMYLDPVTVKIVESQPKTNPFENPDMRIRYKTVICYNSQKAIWLGIIYGYKFLFLLFGAFLAWETRNVHIRELNDSRYIGMSVYNVFVISAIGALLNEFVVATPTVKYVMIAILTLLGTTITLCLVFVPKVRRWKSDPLGKVEQTRTRFGNANRTALGADRTSQIETPASDNLIEEFRKASKSSSND
ncbi:Gamma-aminobutyric acid type B receptor subunit 2 [Trichoplax sp. H2]|nr:Gamma-aminobutyric acid type B receptor subunit 2 [Trichoplax sp. H2]|eukprot:RDD44650.1 Gamma-aminobutyric acid type B receptor subunit 2 [Trichoplax sp. H2]